MGQAIVVGSWGTAKDRREKIVVLGWGRANREKQFTLGVLFSSFVNRELNEPLSNKIAVKIK